MSIFERNAVLQEESMREIHAWRAGDKSALTRLSATYEGRIKSMVTPLVRKGFNRDDLVSVATIGFMTAITKYDESHGASVHTYVKMWVRATLEDFIVKERSVGMMSRDAYAGMSKAIGMIDGEHKADAEALTKEGFAKSMVDRAFLKKGFSMTRIDALAQDDGDEVGMFDFMTKELAIRAKTAETILIERQSERIRMRAVRDAIEHLAPRQREVASCLLENGDETLLSIARAHGYSGRNASQVWIAARKRIVELTSRMPDVAETMAPS